MGTGYLLDFGMSRTVYSYAEKLVLKIGDRSAQMVEKQMSERFPGLVAHVHAYGEAHMWANGVKEKHVPYLIMEKIEPFVVALQSSRNPKRLVMDLMHWLLSCADAGLFTRDAKIQNLGIRNGQVVSLDAGAYEVSEQPIAKS